MHHTMFLKNKLIIKKMYDRRGGQLKTKIYINEKCKMFALVAISNCVF